MPQPLRNILQPPTPRTPGETASSDLPVNPLYAIHYTIAARQLSSTPSLTNPPPIPLLLELATDLQVLWRGSTVISITPTQAAILAMYAQDQPPTHTPLLNTTAIHHSLTITIPLGRRHKRATECFPATRRGELVFQRTLHPDPTTLGLDPDSIIETIHTTELLGADPNSFIKATRLQKLSTTAGHNDLDLPLGNPIAAIILHGPTPNTQWPLDGSITDLRILVDNVEWDTAATLFPSLTTPSHDTSHPASTTHPTATPRTSHPLTRKQRRPPP